MTESPIPFAHMSTKKAFRFGAIHLERTLSSRTPFLASVLVSGLSSRHRRFFFYFPWGPPSSLFPRSLALLDRPLNPQGFLVPPSNEKQRCPSSSPTYFKVAPPPPRKNPWSAPKVRFLSHQGGSFVPIPPNYPHQWVYNQRTRTNASRGNPSWQVLWLLPMTSKRVRARPTTEKNWSFPNNVMTKACSNVYAAKQSDCPSQLHAQANDISLLVHFQPSPGL